mgnify:CR=1 FL=1
MTYPICDTFHVMPKRWRDKVEHLITAGMQGGFTPACEHFSWDGAEEPSVDLTRLRVACSDCHTDSVANDLVTTPIGTRTCDGCQESLATRLCTLVAYAGTFGAVSHIWISATATVSRCDSCHDFDHPGGNR